MISQLHCTTILSLAESGPREDMTVNALRIRFESIKWIDDDQAEITFSGIDGLKSSAISFYDIFVSYELVSQGRVINESKIAASIPPSDVTTRQTMTTVVSVPPKELSNQIKIGIRASCEPNIHGPVGWSKNINEYRKHHF